MTNVAGDFQRKKKDREKEDKKWIARFITYSSPGRADTWFPSLPRKECTGVRYVITKFSRMDGLPNFITHGAPLACFARRSSAKTTFSRSFQLAHQLALKLLLWKQPFSGLTFFATFIVWVHNIFTQLSLILFHMPNVFHFGRVCWQKFQNQYFKFLPTGHPSVTENQWNLYLHQVLGENVTVLAFSMFFFSKLCIFYKG